MKGTYSGGYHQGTIFFKPFFFLLVDSLLESALVAVAVGWAFAWGVAFAAPVACVCWEGGLLSEAIGVVGGLPWTEFSVDAAGGSGVAGTFTGVLAGAAGAVLAAEEASASDVGAATISAPRFVDGAFPVDSDVAPSTTGPESVAVPPAASLTPGF